MQQKEQLQESMAPALHAPTSTSTPGPDASEVHRKSEIEVPSGEGGTELSTGTLIDAPGGGKAARKEKGFWDFLENPDASPYTSSEEVEAQSPAQPIRAPPSDEVPEVPPKFSQKLPSKI